MFFLTTSWDDGDILDIKLANLLNIYNTKGTFYISKRYRAEHISDNQIREISKCHEIGAHTITHPDLRLVSKEEKKKEILGSKEWLEKITGKNIEMFCYPFGYYDKESVDVVKECGFSGARTIENTNAGEISNQFLMPVTLQVYPFPFRKKDDKSYYWGRLLQPLVQRYKGFYNIGVPLTSMISWESVAHSIVDKASIDGGIIHLWGHSWEIEKYGMWEELEELLKYCSRFNDCKMITNSESIKLL
jgi:hypothetical protein